MKIGIDVRNIGKQRTGSEMVVLELTKSVLKLDKKNEYVLFTDTDDAQVLRNIREKLEIGDDNNKVKIVSLKAQSKFVWAFWSVSSYLRKNPVDIYHTEYILPFFIPKKVKAVTHIHDVSFVAYKEFIKWSDLFFLSVLIPFSIKRAHRVIAVSEFTRKEIIKYYGTNPEKVELVYNAVNVVSEKNDAEREKMIRERYSLPDKFILYVGTLQPRKNIPTLIRAYAKIESKIPEIKLVIAGNKKAHNFDREIDKAIPENNLGEKVVFPGFIDEKDKMMLYKMAYVFAYPSLYEGFGIPVLEAMVQETPVVSSDIPPLREVCNGACLFFDSNRLDNLSEKLYTICTDETTRNRLVSSGKERVNFFSWKKSGEKMLEIYENILRSK